jgi:hypothetical protein
MALTSITTADLRREIERRERGAKAISARRDKLAKVLSTLDRELAALSMDGTPRRGRGPARTGRTGRKLPTNTLSLPAALAAAVKPGSVVSPADAAKLVKTRGYKTTAKKFGVAVAHTLAGHAGFKRKGRGEYQRVAG